MTIMEIINEKICDNPEILWASLDLEGEIYNGRVDIPCPVHSGDNSHGMTMYFNEYYDTRGKWKCHTRSCERIFKNSPLGFVRGVLSSRYCNWKKSGDKIYDWSDTIKYLKGLYGIDGESKINPGETERKKFIKNCHCVEDVKDKKIICTKEKYLFYYSSPPQYFIDRGFSHKVLEKYNVRYCDKPNSKLYRRCCVPVYDEQNRNVIGISARTTCDEEPKWRNTTDFPSGTSLYNYSFASESIRRNRTAIIVEGPGNIWKLAEANIHNAVGIWGASGWNDYKKYLLDKLGVMRVVLALDNDEAGRDGMERIKKETGRIYNTMELVLPDGVNDIGEMNVKDVKELFKCII